MGRIYDEIADPLHRFRSIVRIPVERVADSCGFGVPEMDLIGQRSRLQEWRDKRSQQELTEYQRTKNAVSIDGLPALGGNLT